MCISHAADLLCLNTLNAMLFQFITCLGNTDVLLSKVKGGKDEVKLNVKNL